MPYKLSALRRSVVVRTAAIFLCLLPGGFVTAQSKVRGIVVNNNGKPLVNARLIRPFLLPEMKTSSCLH